MTELYSKSLTCLQQCARRGDQSLEFLLEDPHVLKRFMGCDTIPDETEWAHELSQCCHDLFYRHPDWLLMAGRVRMAELERHTPLTFSQCSAILDRLQHPEYAQFVKHHAARLDALIQPERDYNFTLFAMDVLMESYLLRRRSQAYDIVERPQYMYLRTAVFLWFSHPDEKTRWFNIEHMYELTSTHQYTHATPTLFNAGLYTPTLTSCFTMDVADNTQAITKSWHDMAFISKGCGGIGISFSSLRHSEVAQRKQETNLINWAKITQDILKAFNQGNKRKGSAAVFLNIWHIDVEKFIHLKIPHGAEDERARDLFTGLWIHDEFMRRVERDEDWTLFCPHVTPGLDRLWGEEFEMQYRRFEQRALAGKLGPYFKRIKARALFFDIVNAQIESGVPYMLYADAVNRKSNQSNIGPIVTSNLCVSGDTLLLTNKGHLPIATLKDQQVTIWNGHEWSDTVVRQTGEHQDLLTVTVERTMERDMPHSVVLHCTPYHKFYVIKNNVEIMVEAKDLQPDDILIPVMVPQYPTPITYDFYTLKVIKIEEGMKNQTTYCVNEPLRHKAMFNGILTGNCTEILLHTDADNIGSCNLANVALQSCVDEQTKTYDFEKLHALTRYMVRAMDRVIDMNYYNASIPEIEWANKNNRPIGLGVQGLADVFALLDLTWESDEARQLNKEIFETMYHAAVTESVQLAKELGKYPRFDGSPASKGLFQFDLWDMEAMMRHSTHGSLAPWQKHEHPSTRYDWESLRTDMVQHGLRHSLLLALMPTASTASIVGSTECFEPMKQCIYTRTVLSGQHALVNKYCVRELMAHGLWNQHTLRTIIDHKGSIQAIPDHALGDTPEQILTLQHIKNKYKTCFELSQKLLLTLAADRGRYVCQSQSSNCFMSKPTSSKLASYHMTAWKLGLKTGMYYLKQTSETVAIHFGESALVLESEPEQKEPPSSKPTPNIVCTDEVCLVCQ